MRRSSQFAALLGTAVLVLAADQAATADDVLYESATLGPTGLTAEQLTTQAVPGTNVNQFVFVGARFELSQPVVTSRIGGHFAQRNEVGGEFFGALVALDGPDDLPDSGDLSTPDVLGNTLLMFPEPSNEVFGEIELALQPGWYGVVFGSGLFDAEGGGTTVRNGIALPAASLFGGFDGGWGSQSSQFNYGFAVRGVIVPEPQTLLLFILVVASHFLGQRKVF